MVGMPSNLPSSRSTRDEHGQDFLPLQRPLPSFHPSVEHQIEVVSQDISPWIFEITFGELPSSYVDFKMERSLRSPPPVLIIE